MTGEYETLYFLSCLHLHELRGYQYGVGQPDSEKYARQIYNNATSRQAPIYPESHSEICQEGESPEDEVFQKQDAGWTAIGVLENLLCQ